MAAIFISHSNKDEAITIEVRARLDAQGHRSLFVDFDPEYGIPVGRDWERELYRQLRACQVVLVLVSEHSLASRWCFAEITHAKMLGKTLIPVRVAPCELPPILTSRQAIDLVTDREEGFERLWRGLADAAMHAADAFHWDGNRPPYPGLTYLDEADAAVFFGRDAEIQQGLEDLQKLRRSGGGMLMVLGASGSGKSSLVRAGLLARARRDPDQWIVVDPFRPQTNPVQELAMALGRAFADAGQRRDWKRDRDSLEAAANRGARGGDVLAEILLELAMAVGRRESTVLLTIDQFEELLAEEMTTRATQFLSLVRATLGAQGERLVIVGTLRSDFLGAFQQHDGGREFAFSSLRLNPMSAEPGMRQVIEGPARKAGVELEEGLSDFILRDAGSADALPMLAFTLRELYDEHAQDDLLEISEYRDRLGGLSGSLDKAAEAALRACDLGDGKERELRNALVGLVQVNDNGQYTRRTRPWTDFGAADDMLEQFVRARLLVSRGDENDRVIEVAHETLFRAWERLAGWLDEDRKFLDWHRGMQASLASYQESGDLLTGGRLKIAEEWLAERRGQLTPLEVELVVESRNAELAEVEREQRRVRRIRQLAIFSSSVAALALLLGATTTWMSDLARRRQVRAEEATREAMVRLGELNWRQGMSWREDDPILAAHYFFRAAEAYTEGDRDSLARSAAYIGDRLARPLAGTLWCSVPELMNASFSADGSRMLTGDHGVTLWGLPRGAPLSPAAVTHPVQVFWVESTQGGRWGARLSPDGRRAVQWSESDEVNYFEVDPLAPADPTSLEDLVREPARTLGHADSIEGACFDSASTRILTWSLDGTAKLWEAGSDRPLQTFHHGRRRPVNRLGEWTTIGGAAFSPDESAVVTWDSRGTVKLWRIGEEEPARVFFHGPGLLGVTSSADGSRLLTWGAAPGFEGEITSPQWEERRASLAEEDGGPPRAVASVWKVGEEEPLANFAHDSTVLGAQFTADESRVVTWSMDRTVRLWDVPSRALPQGGASRPCREFERDELVRDVTPQPDGQWLLAMPVDDSNLTAWTLGRHRYVWAATPLSHVSLLSPLAGQSYELSHDSPVMGATFSRNGTRILTWSRSGEVKVWDFDRGDPRPSQRFVHGPAVDSMGKGLGGLEGVRLTADESQAWTWGSGTFRLWDLVDESGHPDRRASPAEHGDDPILDPSGTRVWFRTRESTHAIRDLTGNEPLLTLDGHVFVEKRLWSPDGSVILYASVDGAWLRDLDGGDAAQTVSTFEGAAFSEDSSRVALWLGDRLQVWAVGRDEAIQEIQAGGPITMSAFDATGSMFVVGTDQGVATVFRVGEGDPVRRFDHYDFCRAEEVRIANELGDEPRETSDKMVHARFSPDSRVLLTWGGVSSAATWDVASGDPIRFLGPDWLPVHSAKFDREGTRVLLVRPRAAEVWDTFGDALGLKLPQYGVEGAVFDGDEARVLAWGSGAALWDVESTQMLQRFPHSARVSGAAFDSDGSRILTWGHDGAVKIWQVGMLDPVSTFEHAQPVQQAAFGPDEASVHTVSRSFGASSIAIWDLSIDDATPSERSLRWEAHSATTVDESTGHLRLLSSEELDERASRLERDSERPTDTR